MMNKRDTMLTTALAGVMALAGLAGSGAAVAAEPGMEQCAGIVKAGKNDCATSSNACHGHVANDANPEAWVYLPKGTCERLVGARVVAVVDPTPAKGG